MHSTRLGLQALTAEHHWTPFANGLTKWNVPIFASLAETQIGSERATETVLSELFVGDGCPYSVSTRSRTTRSLRFSNKNRHCPIRPNSSDQYRNMAWKIFYAIRKR